MKRILIVEDEEQICHIYRAMLLGKVEFFEAGSVESAEKLINETNAFDLVVMDASIPYFDDGVPDRTPITIRLVKKLRHTGYFGPIIATSGDEESQKLLMIAGCSHQVSKPNISQIVMLVRELLEL